MGRMKNLVMNPYLPSWEYVPDTEPHVVGKRLYVFGSHDQFGGKVYCENDYVLWSCPTEDLSDWYCHGIVYRREQDPNNIPGRSQMWAPDMAIGPDGRCYLFYSMNFVNRVSVAVADKPEGPYEYYGEVHYPDGTRYGGRPKELLRFDPGVLADDDGKIFLYTGFCPTERLFQLLAKNINATIAATGNQVVELEKDMLTVKGEPHFLLPGKENAGGTGFEGHEFYEASSMRKFDGKYYAIYSSFLSHELAWAVSDHPDKGFQFGGTLHSNGNVCHEGEEATYFWGNNHGSVERIGNEYYVFGHRQTNCTEFSRQGVAEKIRFENGRFYPAEMTSQGLYGKPLPCDVRYEAGICCELYGKRGVRKTTKMSRRLDPYVTQTGKDRENDPCQYIANMTDGCVAGYKYFDLTGAKTITIERKGHAYGTLTVSGIPGGEPYARITIEPNENKPSALFTAPDGPSALYFQYEGIGKMHFFSFYISTR